MWSQLDIPKLTWSARQRWYKDQLSRLRLPADSSPADLRRIEAGLDPIAMNARYELSEVKSWLEYLDNLAKKIRASMACSLREQHTGKTEKEREQLVELAFQNYRLELKLMDEVLNVTYDEALKILTERKNFLTATLEECAVKHNRVIAHIATVKVEAMLVDDPQPEVVFQRRARTRKNA